MFVIGPLWFVITVLIVTALLSSMRKRRHSVPPNQLAATPVANKTASAIEAALEGTGSGICRTYDGNGKLIDWFTIEIEDESDIPLDDVPPLRW